MSNIQLVVFVLSQLYTGGKPSGHIYAEICDKVNVDKFNTTIEVLVNQNLITNSGHFLELTEIGKKTIDDLLK